MKKLFYFGLIGFILFEIANVYFLMPMRGGSQEINSIDVAYFLHVWRWMFRAFFILLMILGAYLIDKLANLYANKYIQHALYGILAISFLVFPLYQFENLKDKNKELFEFADVLNKNHIKGKFTSNMSDAGRMWVVAYLTKSNFYTIEQSGFTQEALLNEMKKYQVRYYFFESENNTSTLQMEGMKSIFKYNNIEILELL